MSTPDSAVGIPPALARLAEQAMRSLAEQYPWQGSLDDVCDLAVEAVNAAIPRDKALWKLLYDNPELGQYVGGPGAVAATVEEVVFDSFHESLWWPVRRWVDAVEEADRLVPFAGAGGDRDA